MHTWHKLLMSQDGYTKSVTWFFEGFLSFFWRIDAEFDCVYPLSCNYIVTQLKGGTYRAYWTSIFQVRKDGDCWQMAMAYTWRQMYDPDIWTGIVHWNKRWLIITLSDWTCWTRTILLLKIMPIMTPYKTATTLDCLIIY